MEQEEQRPNPEELLKRYSLENGQQQGKLKIFFGYAAGVGKTYAMLEAAQTMRKAGVDVVVGYVEPHTRPETVQLLAGLEQLPNDIVKYKGITLHELALDAALQRKPRLILVDELAHQNAEGCRHRKRYQDVEELLRAGIDVYTTVNVQHLESLNDVVSAITGVVVGERVPDWVFDSATQVEVVDIEPDDLIQRLEQGKIYREGQAQRAISNFFTAKNLAALREIALRRTADRLGRTAEKVTGGEPVQSAAEHILICLSSAPSNAKVIRTAARMAEAFRCKFTALFVETPTTSELAGENLRRLRDNLKLAEDLGARIATVYGEDIPGQIAEYAKIGGISKIVIGRSNNRKRLFSPRKSLIDRLTLLAPNLDIYIIPDRQTAYRPAHSANRDDPPPNLLDFCKVLLMVAASSLVGQAFFMLGLSEANIITVYILGVLVTSVWTGGLLYGGLGSLFSVLVFNFLFTEPRFTLNAYDAGYPVTFLIMFGASFLTSTLTMRVKRQARQAARKAYRTEVLLETSQKLQHAESPEAIIIETAGQMRRLLGRTVVFYAADDSRGGLQEPQVFAAESSEPEREFLTPAEQGVAQWVYRNNKHAGATTNTLPSAHCLYLAVRGQQTVFAVAGVLMEKDKRELDSFEKNLLIALLGECGLALEKSHLSAAKVEVELRASQERLRANMLRAISHDLRTPLTSISGNAGILMESADALAESKKQQLYTDIYDDSMWLIGLVENLLSVTRLEDGTLNLNLQAELLDDVFREAVQHLDRKAAEHQVAIRLDDDLLLAKMDARLVVQVIINIVNNAVKYTPPGSHITLSAERHDGLVAVEIADDGPGIPDESKSKIFDMFFTTANASGDSRRGLGLGLCLCRSIVEAHGGTISLRNNQPNGTVFSFTLQASEVTDHE